MTPHPRRWFLNVGLGYVDLAVTGLVFVVMTPLLVGRLGAEAYAIWVLGHAIAAYLGMLDLGLGDTQVRFVARFAGSGRTRALQDLTSTITVLLAAAGCLALLAGAAIALGPREWWAEIAASREFDLRAVIVLLAVQVFVAIPSAALDNVYEGLQRFDLQAARSVALRVLSAGAQIWLLLDGHGVVTIVAIGVAATSLCVFVDLVVVNWLSPGLLRIPLDFNRRVWSRIRRYAMWSSADDLLAEAGSYIDDILLVMLLPFGLLTPYSVATTVTMALHLAAQPITTTLYPLASSLQARRLRTSLATLVIRGTQAAAGAAAPLGIAVAFFGVDIVAAWVPDAAPGTSATLFAVLALSAFISVFLWTGWVVLAATGAIRTVVKLLVVELVVEAMLIVVLAPKLGLLGIALADLGGNAAVGVVLELPLVARLVGMPVTTFVARSLGRLAVPALLTVAAAYWARQRGLGDDLAGLIAVVTGLFALYVAALLLTSSRQERLDFAHLWRSIRSPEDATEQALPSSRTP
jgi:O-antigen/teichoic acid export membrane protein